MLALKSFATSLPAPSGPKLEQLVPGLCSVELELGNREGHLGVKATRFPAGLDFFAWQSREFPSLHSGSPTPDGGGMVEDRLRVKTIRFGAGRDFAITRASSSPCFSCACRFNKTKRLVNLSAEMASRSTELFMMLNKRSRWCHSNVCALVSSVDIVDLNLRIKIDPVKQPVKRNSVGSGYVSHSRTSAFNFHLDHCFAVLKICETCVTARKLFVRRDLQSDQNLPTC